MSKLLFFIMWLQCLFASLAFCNNAFSQDLEKTKIVCGWENISLEKALTDIQIQTEYFFSYDVKQIEKVHISGQPDEELNLLALLKFISAETGLNFSIVDDLILVRYESEKDVDKEEVILPKSKIQLPTLKKLNQMIEQLDYKIIYQQFGKSLNQVLKGIVLNENNEPLIGATVVLKTSGQGTTTDTDGSFALSLPDTGSLILEISYIGYQTKEVMVTNPDNIEIKMIPDVEALDEVIVVGYGIQKKANLTGAVTNVKDEDINKRPITHASQALQGLAPGLFINTNSGEPGNDDASIVIRGVGTLNNAEPLVLIDGIEAPLANVNTNDIESINVLKDAASASIYGTRAANGVILITTKRGIAGKPVVKYNGSHSITSPTVLPKMVMDSRLYLEKYVEAAEYSSRNHPFTSELIDELSALPGTNWIEDYINMGYVSDHDLSISGGTDKYKYRFSTRYFDQQGYIEGDWFTKRLNSRLNVDFDISEKFNAGVSMSFVNMDNRQAPKNDPNQGGFVNNSGIIDRYGGKGNFLYTILLVNAPYASVFDEFGRYSGTGSESTRSQRDNPQGLIDNQWIDIDENEYLGSIFAEYSPINNLTFRYTLGINSQQQSYQETRLEYEQYTRFGDRSAVRVPGSLLRTQESTILNFTNLLQATFTKSFGDHDLRLLAGANQETSDIRRISTFETGFGSTALVNVGNGTESVDIANFNGEWALQSVFGRLNYSYLDKYLLELNFRRDGSSRFGSNNRWGSFPGVSVGYVISKEDFWNINFMSHLKLRASWGRLGVQSANLYPFASEILLGRDYNGSSGAALTKLGNPNLVWEETTNTNFGLDMELFNGKVYIEGDYFRNESDGILTDLENPLTVGISDEVSVNSAKIINEGWELAINVKSKIGRFGLNVTNIKNEVTQINPELTNQDDRVQVGTADNIWWIRGEPVNAIFGHEFGGIFQVEDFNGDGALVSGIDYSWVGTPRPGDIKYIDQNGDNIINEEDMVVIGNRNPEWLFGLNYDVNFKQWDLGFFVQGVAKVDGFVNRYTGNYGHSGLREFWLDGWTEENRSNTIPRIFVDRDGFNGRTISGNGGLAMNEFWVIDQSYLRLKNIAIGYTFPKRTLENIFIENARVYLSGQNLVTLSELDDLDPERSPFANHFGGTLPQAKSITIGVNLTF